MRLATTSSGVDVVVIGVAAAEDAVIAAALEDDDDVCVGRARMRVGAIHRQDVAVHLDVARLSAASTLQCITDYLSSAGIDDALWEPSWSVIDWREQ